MKEVNKETKTSIIQTLVVIGVAIAALVGSVGGAAATLLFAGAFGLPILGPAGGDLTEREVESRIVELIEEESATIAVVERITPAVVSIVVKKERGDVYQDSTALFMNPFFYPTPLTEQSAAELVEVSSGTGFFVTSDGYILTNRHVIDEEGATFIVVTNDGVELPAELVDSDPFQDIALLRVEGGGYPTVTLGNSDGIRIGQTVIAIGNTLSEFRNTVTKGVVSGINRRVTAGDATETEVIEAAIQTDAAINPGNSGGPLINLLGEVIGINTAVSFEGESIGFAIPINEAKRAIEDVQAFGRIVRPWLGVRYVLVEPDAAADIAYEVGAMIVSGSQPGEAGVFPGSPADLAGLKEEDIVIAVGGIALAEDRSLAELVSVYHPGDVVIFSVLRAGAPMEFNVTLAEYDEE
ncbi:trypsin-like peptidase domain-containing protein [Candidatus Uhrbacteria bacterium]|nr:trypsin-like peptidase domain-containing protein [Candidatus Uhrbacteria bacterium]